jgi:hypothetical protein
MRIAHRASPVVLGLSVVLVACQEPTGENRPAVVQEPSFELAGASCGSRVTITDAFTNHWPCDQGLRLVFDAGFPDSLEGTVSGAATTWDEELRSATLRLPRFTGFTAGKTPQTIQVLMGNTSGTCWWGEVPKTSPTYVRFHRGSSTTCGTSTLRNVAIQEFSHVLGFHDKWDGKGPDSTLGHCSGRSYAGQVYGNICQHEIETVYRAYSIRSSLRYDQHIMTGLQGLRSLTMEIGTSANLSVTHLLFDRANGTLCGKTSKEMCPPETARGVSSDVTLNWSASPAIVSITPTGAGASKTITADTTGTTTIKVTASSSVYQRGSQLGDPGTGTTAAVTVVASPPAAAPSNLAASNITATSARISWTNGDTSAGTTTFVRYRITGTTQWITANGGVGLAAGVSSYNLTGLHCATSYDVSVFHQKNGINSAAITLTLFTTAACQVSSTINPPSGFRQTGCTPSSSGGKSYATYHVAWTAGANPSTSIFHIVESFSNTPGSAIIRRGPITTTTANLGPYLVQSTSSPRYFWVRHANGAQASAWVALQGNPIAIRDGCLL